MLRDAMGKRRRELSTTILRIARSQPEWSAETIAGRVGCHPSTVHKHLRERRVRSQHCAAALNVEQRATAMLAGFSRDADDRTRATVADNPSASPRMLGRLAGDCSLSVRCAAASNPQTPVKMLARLAHASDRGIRIGVAENTSASLSMLARLRRDRDDNVRWNALTNPSCPAAEVEQAAAGNGYMEQAAAARHPNCPTGAVERLAAHADLHLRTAAAVNLASRNNDDEALRAALDTAIKETVAELRQETDWDNMIADQVTDPDEDTVEQIVDVAAGAIDTEQLFDCTAHEWRGGYLRDELAQAAVDAFYADIDTAGSAAPPRSASTPDQRAGR